MSAEQEKIKDLAYRLWQESGCPHGRDQHFWYEAEQSVKAAKPPAKPKAAAKPKADATPKAVAKPKAAAAAKPKAKAPAKAKA